LGKEVVFVFYVPDFLVNMFYKRGSLRNANEGLIIRFSSSPLKGKLEGINRFLHNDKEVEIGHIELSSGEKKINGNDINGENPFKVLENEPLDFSFRTVNRGLGNHTFVLELLVDGVGLCRVRFRDYLP
jgi:hypothetical protein